MLVWALCEDYGSVTLYTTDYDTIYLLTRLEQNHCNLYVQRAFEEKVRAGIGYENSQASFHD